MNVELTQTHIAPVAGLAVDKVLTTAAVRRVKHIVDDPKGQTTPLGGPLVPRCPRPCRRAPPSAGADKELCD